MGLTRRQLILGILAIPLVKGFTDMQAPVPVLSVVTYPPGASQTQARLVIDGVRGAIFEYANGGPVGALVSSWARSAGTDPYGNPYPQGFDAGSGSSFTGTDFVINSNGEFFYSGTPTLGNLVFSIAPANGTDAFGNPYKVGVYAYGSSGGAAALVTAAGEAGLILPPGGTSHDHSPPQVFSFNGNPGAANEFQAGVLLSGTETTNTGNAAVQVFSETDDGTGGARGALIITGNRILGWNATQIEVDQPIFLVPGTAPTATGAYLFDSPNGIPSAQTADGFNGAIGITGAANTANNATVNAQTNLSKLSNIWPIPASDANAGTIYRLTAAGTATWGSTQESLTLAIAAFGLSNFISLPIGATEFTASLTLQWRYQADIVVQIPGNPATIMGGAKFDIGVSGANELTQAGTNQSAGGFAAFNAANNTANTAAAANITLQAKWGGAFGSITCDYSYLERLGA